MGRILTELQLTNITRDGKKAGMFVFSHGQTEGKGTKPRPSFQL